MKALFLCAFAILSLTAISCRKCTKCEYKYTLNNSTQTVPMEEICGNSQDVDDQVQACQDLAKANNGTCACADL